MNNEEKNINKTSVEESGGEAIKPNDEAQFEALNNLQDDIIRNDIIPETSRITPGSNGAFPVGAFDNSKDY